MPVSEEFLLNQTVKRYNYEVSRMRNLDNKAGNQIGYVGIILAVLGFVFATTINELNDASLMFLIIGVIGLFCSIGLAIYQLTPKPGRVPVLKIREFYQDWKSNSLECDMIDVYFDHIDDMMRYNNSKIGVLKWVHIFTLFGLAVSFIGIFIFLIPV